MLNCIHFGGWDNVKDTTNTLERASVTAVEDTRNEEEPESDAEDEVTPDASGPAEEQDKADLPSTRELRPQKNIKPPERYQDYSAK